MNNRLIVPLVFFLLFLLFSCNSNKKAQGFEADGKTVYALNPTYKKDYQGFTKNKSVLNSSSSLDFQIYEGMRFRISKPSKTSSQVFVFPIMFENREQFFYRSLSKDLKELATDPLFSQQVLLPSQLKIIQNFVPHPVIEGSELIIEDIYYIKQVQYFSLSNGMDVKGNSIEVVEKLINIYPQLKQYENLETLMSSNLVEKKEDGTILSYFTPDFEETTLYFFISFDMKKSKLQSFMYVAINNEDRIYPSSLLVSIGENYRKIRQIKFSSVALKDKTYLEYVSIPLDNEIYTWAQLFADTENTKETTTLTARGRGANKVHLTLKESDVAYINKFLTILNALQ